MKTLNKNLLIALILGLAFGLTACKSEIDDKPAATVVEGETKEQPAEKAADAPVEKAVDAPAEKAADAPTDAPADPGAAKTVDGTFNVDLASSSIKTVGAKVTGDHTLDFKKFEGKIDVKAGQPAAIDFTLQMGEFTTDIDNEEMSAKFIGHMKSADFLDAEKFPTATFKSTKIEAGSTAAGTHQIEGEMTLRGVTKTISFPATLTLDGAKASGKAEFTINRKDFGIVYAGKADDLIKDDVLLKLDLNFNTSN